RDRRPSQPGTPSARRHRGPSATRDFAAPFDRYSRSLMRFHGLPFARWHQGLVFFATPESPAEIHSTTQASLKILIRELELYRHPLAPDTRHALYRARPERWLEALVCQDITRIDSAFDPRFVYPQFFARAGHEQGILDVLAVTRAGRLAIVELK